MSKPVDLKSSIIPSNGFQFPGVEVETYKDEPGTWVAVSRRVLGSLHSSFQSRYFEMAAGGYTSFERHEHEHFVVILRGSGRVRLGDEWSEVGPGDVVRIAGNTPHQFTNPGTEPFGILCVVDNDRDRPILLDPDGNPRPSEE